MSEDDLASISFFRVPTQEELSHLPKAPPDVPIVEFTQAADGWPPKPVGVVRGTPLQGQGIPGSLTEELEQKIRTPALRNQRVRKLLGNRFAHISSHAVRPAKGKKPRSIELTATRLMFFSHSNNVAVEVLMKGTRVQHVGEVERYQPPEGVDEIKEAIDLARSDTRLESQIRGLTANAILLPNREEADGPGHRIMWVTFTGSSDTGAEKPALFSAAVDLTIRKVIMARSEPPIE